MVDPANPATQLEGQKLAGGWLVGPLLPKHPNATGGTFSQCYTVTDDSGKVAFLKALDYYTAFGKGTDMIQIVSTLFNFEKDILAVCETRRMDRVVRAIADGVVDLDPKNSFAQVPYLIFESAEADIRRYLGTGTTATISWKLRALHHIATGLKQLHGAGIAHQDLKPSNVLIFLIDKMLTISKVADLGNCSSLDRQSLYDSHPWAGDRSYAPPEIRYGQIDLDWNRRRISSDVYLLGSMVSFVFTSTTASAALDHFTPLQFKPGNWGGSYQGVLTYVTHAFTNAVQHFEANLPPNVPSDVVLLYKQLCEPDPSRRGTPRTAMNKVALDRVVTRLDLLSRRAEAIGL